MTTPDSVPAVALEPKTKLSGKILKTTLAGALVDIGQSLPGVLHISQISETPVNKVEDVVKEGQTVEVWVRRVKKDRIELTMIPLALPGWMFRPWTVMMARFALKVSLFNSPGLSPSTVYGEAGAELLGPVSWSCCCPWRGIWAAR